MTHKNKSKNKSLEGFSKLKFNERLQKLKDFSCLGDEDIQTLIGKTGLSIEKAEYLIENVIGLYSLPIGLATNFLIDGVEKAIPMVVEETSIVAAASSAAKWIKRNGGFKTNRLGNLIIGQIQFPLVKNFETFERKINENKEELIELANSFVPSLVARGGGVEDLKVRIIDRGYFEKMAVIHILANPCDAMGANLINQICEALKNPIEKLTNEKVGLCILSNLVDSKLYEAQCEISDISEELARSIEEATLFANLDPYRCATHNKGVMNGIDPILIATGNDWRAVEAAVHAYVSKNGRYRSITEWKFEDGKLKGRICIPLAVGTVGGMTKIHPTAQVALKILGVQNADELSRIIVCVGLAQNLAALRALCSEGIVKGHMRLHAANLAIMAGANTDEVKIICELLKDEEHITLTRAKELLNMIRSQKTIRQDYSLMNNSL